MTFMIFCVILYPVIAFENVFHERTKIVFKPDREAELFGFSVLLNSNGLVVGAPKAVNYVRPVKSGLVYTCSVDHLNSLSSPCEPMRLSLPRDFIQKDMGFGSSIDATPDGNLIVFAPHHKEETFFNNGARDEYLEHGASYYGSQNSGRVHYALRDDDRQALRLTRAHPGYEEYTNQQIWWYGLGQAGISVKAVGNHSYVAGAPGLLHWTGTLIYYDHWPNMQIKSEIVINTLNMEGLGPDEYYGYSVESGVFRRNGKVLLVGGAPRSKAGYGQVLVIELGPFWSPIVLAKIQGPQLGAYFGASVCCVDIDNDGVTDLLVGAPNYADKGGERYDQGAVFVYMTRQTQRSFTLELTSKLRGSKASGAKFGNVISSLGDIDRDGFNDAAIGAPWEEDGSGAVYIYKGNSNGLEQQYSQRIAAPKGATSFGIAISSGFDVDRNNCNDVAIGAANSSSVYLYRCVPPVRVITYIKAPNANDLPQNTTEFLVRFCFFAENHRSWPKYKIGIKATISIDPKERRAQLPGNAKKTWIVKAGFYICDPRNITIKPNSDLSTPISMSYTLEPDDILNENTTVFDVKAARVSKKSKMFASILIQFNKDCGSDQICNPWLNMNLQPFHKFYVPGVTDVLGAKLTIVNIEEPAYGAKVNITLPSTPIRVPSDCSIDGLVMTCDVTSPLARNEQVSWDIMLQYKPSSNKSLSITAELHSTANRNLTNEYAKEVTIEVSPQASFNVEGKPLPNDAVSVSRVTLNEAKNISFIHRFMITNTGPSEWFSLAADIRLPDMVNLTAVEGCTLNSTQLSCMWPHVTVNTPLLLSLPLYIDLTLHGNKISESKIWNLTSSIALDARDGNTTTDITTTLRIQPTTPLWPLIVGILVGIIVFAVVVYILHRYGFFTRTVREEMQKKLIEENEASNPEPGTSESTVDDS